MELGRNNLGQIGSLKLVECLDAGGGGEVWRAWDEERAEPRAVKFLHAELQGRLAGVRFQREVKAGATQHPHLVRIYEHGHAMVDRGVRAYLVMELLSGQTLHATLRRRAGAVVFEEGPREAKAARVSPLPPRTAVRLLWQVASGVGALHARGYVHRDIKPKNLFLHACEDKHLRAKVIDYGLAKRLAGSREVEVAVTSYAPRGTLGYSAPEQWGHEEVAYGADVFSLGVVLFECLFGKRPYPAESEKSYLAHCQSPLAALPPEPALPPFARDFLLRMLDPVSPERRPSVHEVATMCREWLSCGADQGEFSPDDLPFCPDDPPDFGAAGSERDIELLAPESPRSAVLRELPTLPPRGARGFGATPMTLSSLAPKDTLRPMIHTVRRAASAQGRRAVLNKALWAGSFSSVVLFAGWAMRDVGRTDDPAGAGSAPEALDPPPPIAVSTTVAVSTAESVPQRRPGEPGIVGAAASSLPVASPPAVRSKATAHAWGFGTGAPRTLPPAGPAPIASGTPSVSAASTSVSSPPPILPHVNGQGEAGRVAPVIR